MGAAGSTDATGGAARFNVPAGLTVRQADGTFSVSETTGSRIRQISPAGVVTSVAGTYTAQGYINAFGSAARFTNPYGLVARESNGDLIITDHGNHRVRYYRSNDRYVSTIYGNGVAADTVGFGTSASVHFPYGAVLDNTRNTCTSRAPAPIACARSAS